jgi:RHS repeat-associated protein
VLEVTVLDAAGNQSSALRVPVTAPPPQAGNVGLIHGIVLDSRTQQPLHGVRVSARGVSSTVMSDGAGRFAFPAPGTGSFTLFFARDGYITARRDQYVLEERQATVGEVRLHRYDPNVTVVTTAGGTVSDSAGKVQVIFPPGAVSEPMPVSATVFGGEPDFPLPMPEGTVFLAGVQMTPEHTAFLQPVTLRFANDLGFAPGTSVPFAFASHDPEDASEGFYDPGVATVSADGAFIELQVTHFSCVALGVAPPPGANEGEECPACAEQEEVDDPEMKCDVAGTSSVCLTDGSVRLEQRLASVGALGGRDSLEFAYTSATAHPRPILSTRTRLSSLYFPVAPLSSSWKVALEGVEREIHFQGSSDTTHLAYAWDGIDAAGQRLSTGAYHFRATSIGSFSGALYTADTFGGLPTVATNVQSPQPLPYRVSTGGYAIFHDQSNSPFGAGWGLSELERLHPQPDGTVLWTSGRGAAAVMRPGHPRDEKAAFRTFSRQTGGIARDASGAMYVGSYDGTITRIASDGTTSAFATVASTLSSLAFDRLGNLHALTYNGRLFRLSPSGGVTQLAFFGFDLGDMVVDSKGNVFVVDSHHPKIYRVTPDGEFSTFAGYQAPNRLLTYPSGLAIDSNDNLYVSNNYNTPGQFRCGVSFISKITPAGGHSYYAVGLNAPRGMSFDDRGNLYVADVSCPASNGVDLKVVSPTGLVTTLDPGYPSPRTGAVPPYGYSYDPVASPDGKVYLVADNGILYETWVMAPPAGLPVRYPGPAGEHSILERHADGSFTRTSKDGTRSLFDARGRQTARLLTTGDAISYEYDGAGRLVERTNAVGQSWQFAYSGGGLSSVTDPAGRTTAFNVASGNLLEVTHPDGSTVSFEYDARHLLTGKTDARGFRTSYDYDANAKAKGASLPTGETRGFDIGRSRTSVQLLPPALGTVGSPAPPVRAADREDRYTDGRGFTWRFVSNGFGAVTKATRPDAESHLVQRDVDNNPVELRHPGGGTIVQRFDRQGNLTEHDEQGGRIVRVQYDRRFAKPTRIEVGDSGSAYDLAYDSGGNLVSLSDARGARTLLTVGAHGLTTRADLPDAGAVTYSYDSLGRLTEVKDQLQRVTRLAYDPAGNVTRVTDPASRTTEYRYDAMNRLLEVKDALGQTTSFAYEAACSGCDGNPHLLTRITDALNHSTRFEYDAIGQLVTLTDPLDRSRHFTYDLNRNLASVTDPRGQTTRFEYDALDRLVRRTRPEGADDYGYDLASNLVSLNDGTSSIALVYDVANRLVRVTPAGLLPSLPLEYSYDRQNDRTSLAAPWGSSGYVYDRAGNLELMTGLPGISSSIIFNHDGLGRRIAVYGSQAETLRYDLAGQLLTRESHGGAEIGFEYGYDLAGNRTSETLSETFLTAAPRISATPDPAVALTSRALLRGTAAGAEVTINDTPVVLGSGGSFEAEVALTLGDNTVTIEATRPGGASSRKRLSISAEPVPAPAALFSADAGGTIYGVDADGRAISVASDGSLAVLSTLAVSPTHIARAADGSLYAWYGSQLRRLDPGSGSLVDVASLGFVPDDVALYTGGSWLVSQGLTLHRFEPASGALTAWITLPSLAARVVLAANAGGEVAAATDAGEVFHIDPSGEVTEWASAFTAFLFVDDIALDDAGNAFVIGFDSGEQRSIHRFFSPSGEMTQLFGSYTLPTAVADPAGNFVFFGGAGLERIPAGADTPEPFLSSPSDLVVQLAIEPPLPSVRAREFAYDNIDRLTSATPGEAYAYDAAGNRTASHRSALDVVDVANQLLEDDSYVYSYDLNGNLSSKTSKLDGNLTRYFWDSQDRLVRVEIPGTVAEYVYDPLGRRIQKTVNGVVTKYLYDGEDIAAELDASGSVISSFVHGPGIDEPLTMTRAGQTYTYHRDGLGSITHLTDEAGQVVQRYAYDAYGNIAAEFDPGFMQPYAFTGREWDPETGLYYYRARYYDPKIGRFISEDPIGFGAGDVNFYSYVFGNPINWTDPSGMLLDGGLLRRAAARTAARTAGGWAAALVEPSPVGEIAMGVATLALGIYEIYDAQRGKQNVRETEFEGKSDAEIDEIAESDPDPARRAKAQKEQKARGRRNKQKRGKKCD